MLHPVLALILIALLALRPTSLAGSPPPPTWTPDSVPDAFAMPVAALMWPGATRAFVVDARGDLGNGRWRFKVTAGANGRPASPPRRLACEDRWLPVVHWTEHAGDVRWEFEAAALPIPTDPLTAWNRELAAWRVERTGRDSGAADSRLAPPHLFALQPGEDIPLVVTVRATAHNDGAREERVSLDVALVRDQPTGASRETASRGGSPAWGWWNARADSAIAWCDGLSPEGTLRRAFTLEPKQSASVRFIAASHPLAAASLAAWARVNHDARTRAAREWWMREVSRGMRLRLADTEVEDAVRAARVILLSCRERRSGHWVALGEPFHAREAELGDGARAAAALAAHGYTSAARELAESFLAAQQPRGAFAGSEASLAGSGQAMWCLGQVMLRPSPGGRLGAAATAAYAAWAWCERVRGLHPCMGIGAGLIPRVSIAGAPVAEPRTASDAWALTGYTATERLLRACGRDADADRVAASRREYAIAFARAVALSGSGDIPATYSGTGRDEDNLAVAYPCDALPATAPRIAALAQRTWGTSRHPGLGRWNSPDSLHGYLAADLATWAMRTGRRAEGDAALEGLLIWRNATGAGGELFTRGGDYGSKPPPSARAAAALLQVVRNSLIDDDGERLCLTQGARARWWRNARVDGAPTRWGTVSLAFDRTLEQAHWRWSPVPVWTALTLPPGTQVAGELDAPLLRGPRADVILAPPGTQQARVRLQILRRDLHPASQASAAAGSRADLADSQPQR